MTSIHWPSTFLFTLILTTTLTFSKPSAPLRLATSTANDPKLYRVQQLTKAGDHSFPRFSPDKRYIYFSAKGDAYGKACDDVYRLDMNYVDADNDPHRISRVSTGLGHATRVSFPTDSQEQLTSLMYESSFENAFASVGTTTLAKDTTCPTVQCDGTATQPADCALTKIPIEHFKGTSSYFTGSNGTPLTRLGTYNKDLFYDTLAQHNNFTVTTNNDNCKKANAVVTKGTCLTINVLDKKTTQAVQTQDAEFGYYDFATLSNRTETDTWLYFSGRVTDTADTSELIFSGLKTAIYAGTLKTDDGTYTADTANNPFVASSTTTANLYPRAFQKGSALIYTEMSQTGVGILKEVLAAKGTAVAMTDSTLSSKQADINQDEDQILFVRKPQGETDYQVFLASLTNAVPVVGTFEKKSALQDSFDWEYLKVKSHVTFDGRVGRARLSGKQGHLFFELNIDPLEQTKCKQVYHIDTANDDYTSPRLISTGLSTVDGMDFFEHDSNGERVKSIIYSSNFLRAQTDLPTAQQIGGCIKFGCENTKNRSDKIFRTFCDTAKKTKYLGKEFELFQVNMYGNIENQLTKNDYFDGEPSISKGNKMVYSRASTEEVNLIIRDLNTNTEETISIGQGYYGGASFAHDEKNLVFHGTQPDDFASFKNMLLNYQLVDITVSEIYTYNLDSKDPVKLTKDGKFNQNPVFTPDSKHVIFERVDLETGHQTLWQIDVDGKNLIKLTEEAQVNATKIAFVRNQQPNPNMAIFIGDMLPSEYPQPKNQDPSDQDVHSLKRNKNPKPQPKPKPQPIPVKNQIYYGEYIPNEVKKPDNPGDKKKTTLPTHNNPPKTTKTDSGDGEKQTTKKSVPATKKATTKKVAGKATTKASSDPGQKGGKPDGAPQIGAGSIPLMLLGYWVMRNGF